MIFMKKMTTSGKFLFSEKRTYLLTMIIFLFAILYVMGYYRHISIFAMLYGLFLFITKNWISSLAWAFFVWIVYYIVVCKGECTVFERFENGEGEGEGEGEGDGEENDGKEDLREKLASLIKDLEGKSKAGDGMKDTFDNLSKHVEKMKGGIELREDDVENTGPMGIDATKMRFDEEKPDPLKRAQMETYELIDTINTLKDTIQSISPVLSEGRKVMDMFKGLNMMGGGDDE
jgi:hypothetical protein